MLAQLLRPPTALYLALGAAALGGSLVCLKYADPPYVWLGALWAIVLALLAVLGRGTARLVLLNLAAVAGAIGVAEGYLWVDDTPESRFEGIYDDDGYWRPHDALGYAPTPRVVRPSARRFVGDTLIYDVSYSIDANGLRTTRSTADHGVGPCLLFFGGSYTFGEGVDDADAMPQQVATMAGEPVRVYNFGFHGYGPHQMLAALQHGVVDEIVGDCPGGPVAVYQAIGDHVRRVAGYAWWDREGPRYRLADGGRLEAGGAVGAPHHDWIDVVLGQAEKSRIWKGLFGYWLGLREHNVALFAAIVEASAALVEQRNRSFHVILWDTDRAGRRIGDALERRGVRFHRVSAILPDFRNQPERYVLHRYDPHPNAAAHRAIARYVADHILG